MMVARVSDPALLPDLDAHLRGMGCVTIPVSEDRLGVEIPDVPREAAELELDLYLRVWAVKMPFGQAERVV